MPLYEYRCKKCNKTFEALILDPQEEKTLRCKRCKASKLERLLSGFSMGGASRREASACSSAACSRRGRGCGSCSCH
jgi:putative FmdB family regulatory protein